MCQALSLLSPAHKGHPALFVPQLGTLRAQGLFCFFFLSGGLSSSCLSSGKEESHSSRATPQITAGNQATQGLILSDGTRAGLGEPFPATIQYYLCSGCHKSYLCAVHTCRAGAGAQPAADYSQRAGQRQVQGSDRNSPGETRTVVRCPRHKA